MTPTCPNCGSRDITPHSIPYHPEWDNGRMDWDWLYLDMECEECGQDWVRMYKYEESD